MTGGTWFWFAFGLAVAVVLVGRMVGKWLVFRFSAREALEEMVAEGEWVRDFHERKARWDERVKRMREEKRKKNPPKHPPLPAPLDYKGQGHTLDTFRRRGPGNSSPWANLTPAELMYERDFFLAVTAVYRPAEVLERWVRKGEILTHEFRDPLGWIYVPQHAEEETR